MSNKYKDPNYAEKYYLAHKKKMNKRSFDDYKNRNPIECVCGSLLSSQYGLNLHMKTQKHKIFIQEMNKLKIIQKNLLVKEKEQKNINSWIIQKRPSILD